MASLPLQAVRRARAHRARLAAAFPWTTAPLLVAAPMRILTGPALVVAVARAGGLGFLGPGATPAATQDDLAAAAALLDAEPLLSSSATPSPLLPVGVGFQLWNGDLDAAAAAVRRHRPCAVWLFAPRRGQPELAAWTRRLREASPGTQVWVQVGTLPEAVAAAAAADVAADADAAPDVLVLQGAEAGGHGRATDGIGLITLLPEVADALAQSGADGPPLVAAGGVADGRGVAAALGLGAAAVAMGSRFLAAAEARIAPAYQAAVVAAADGARHTGRTRLYNELRGTFGWPAPFSPRGLLNQTWTDAAAGVPFETLQARHDAAAAAGGAAAWGADGRVATYVGASVGLIRRVQPAAAIVDEVRAEAEAIVGMMGP